MQAETATAQLKKEFQFTLSKLSHEIRNPIALINSELQLMASSHPGALQLSAVGQSYG